MMGWGAIEAIAVEARAGVLMRWTSMVTVVEVRVWFIDYPESLYVIILALSRVFHVCR